MQYTQYRNFIVQRREAGLSEPMIARICGVSVFVIRNILADKNYRPLPRTISRIIEWTVRFTSINSYEKDKITKRKSSTNASKS